MMGPEYPETQGHLGQIELTVLLAMVMSSRIFLGLPRMMASIGGTAGWLSLTIAFLGALLGFILLDALLARFPGLDLIDIARRTTGVLYPLVGLAFVGFFLSATTLVIRQFAETFITGILPRTPIGVITGMLLFLLVFASYMGLETIGRLAMLYAPYLLLFLTLIVILVLPNAQLLNLTPIFGVEARRMLLPSLAKSSVFADIVLVGIFHPVLRDQSKRRKVGLSALFASYLVFLFIIIVVTTVFDYPGSTNLLFPVYQLARLISLAEFFQRAEAVFIFLWFFVAVIGLSAAFYSISYISCRIFSLRSHRPLLFPLAVIFYSLSLLPGSFSDTIALEDAFLRIYAWMPAFLLPALLMLLALLRGKKGAGLG